MATSRAVSVATTETRLDTAAQAAGGSGVQSVAVYNAGAATIHIGGAGVTTAAGYPVAAGEHFACDLAQGDPLYGICASGTVACRVLETGL